MELERQKRTLFVPETCQNFQYCALNNKLTEFGRGWAGIGDKSESDLLNVWWQYATFFYISTFLTDTFIQIFVETL
jgi:hypothetical protein